MWRVTFCHGERHNANELKNDFDVKFPCSLKVKIVRGKEAACQPIGMCMKLVTTYYNMFFRCFIKLNLGLREV
jgi:hypothetical protein